uniref:Uncharacterized protein n=1 Tax=Zeugodacus cucurbitae TaxID=28588 RepID=A0A0A1X2F1_ZEUCU
MEWNSNQSHLLYHLYTFREELRRRRRHESVLKATKTAITDNIIMNNIEFFKFEQVEPVQIAEMDATMELEDNTEDNSEKICANLDCILNDNEYYGKTNVANRFSNIANINWGNGEVMKENSDEDTNVANRFSNIANINWGNGEVMKENSDEDTNVANRFSNIANINWGNGEVMKENSDEDTNGYY